MIKATIIKCFANKLEKVFFKVRCSLWLVTLLFLVNAVNAQDIDLNKLKEKLKTENNDTLKLRYLLILAENEPDGEWEKYNRQLRFLAEKKLTDSLNAKLNSKLKFAYLRFLGCAINNQGYLSLLNGDLSQGLLSFQKAVSIFQSVNDLKLMTSALTNIGSIYVQQGKITNALEVFLRCITYQKKIGDIEGESNSLNNLAYIYQDQGDIVKALENNFSSLKIREKLQDTSGIAYSYINIGSLYSSQNDSVKTAEYYIKGLNLFEKMNNKRGIAQAQNNLGGFFAKYKDFSSARNYFFKSLVLSEEVSAKQIMAQVLAGIGGTFEQEKNVQKTEEFLFKSLNIFKEIDDKKGMANSFNSIGRHYFAQNNFSKAIEYGLKAIDFSKELGILESNMSASLLLYNSYKKTNKTGRALEMYENYTTIKDSINSQKNRNATVYNQFKYEFGQKENAILTAAKAEKEKFEIQTREQKRQRDIIIYSAVILISFGLIFIFFVLRSRKKMEQANKVITQQKQEVEWQKKLVEEKQEEVESSIRYAKRIQMTLFPSEKYIEKHIKKSN